MFKPKDRRETLEKPAVTSPTTTSREEELIAILEAHGVVTNANGLEAVLSFYTEDAIYRQGPAPFTDITRGKRQLRSMLSEMLPGFYIERIWDWQVVEDTVTFMVKCSSNAFQDHLGADMVEAAVEVAFEGDKIKSWNNTFRAYPKIIRR